MMDVSVDVSEITYAIATINVNGISNVTKIDAVRTFVRLMDLDIVFFQEVDGEHFDMFGYDLIYNIDHGKNGTAIAIRSTIRYDMVEKSLDTRVIKLRVNERITVCNIYAPSGSNRRAQRESFFSETVPYYLRNISEYTVMGGDFNCIENSSDSSNVRCANFSTNLKSITQNLRLQDSWNVAYPSRTEFSFIRAGFGSRIDRIYVSQNLKTKISDARFNVVSFSDHKAYILRLKLPRLGGTLGRGVWRYKSMVLNQENKEEFRQKWQYWVSQKQYYRTRIIWWTEYAKPKIISFLRWKAKQMNRIFYDSMEVWYAALKRAYEEYLINPAKVAEINRIKGIMLKLQRNNSLAQRKENEVYLAGEPTSVFQIGDKVKRFNDTIIRSMEIDGRKSTNHTEINDHIVNFYREAFTSERVEENNEFEPILTVPENCEENESLMERVDEDFVYELIKTANSRKSPGTDGLTKDFYLDVWEIIKVEFTEVINDVLAGNVHKKFFDGVIVLIKKNNNADSISRFRPITLLNFDYKVLSRTLKYRLDKLVKHVVSPNQKCVNKQHSIFEATCALRDKIVEFKMKKKKGFMVSFDLERAFDRVEDSFLIKTMQKMRINERFINLIGLIRQTSFSRILINGRLSTEIQIKRSVRQGDPLSMHLFVLYLEPLIQKLNQVCNGQMDLLSVYADDICIVVEDVHVLDRIKEIFERFGRVSGASLNILKTECMIIGEINDVPQQPRWLSINQTLKVLGVVYSNDFKLMIEINWTKVTDSFSRLLWLHKMRNLNKIQKVIFLNTFALSKVWYIGSIFDLPNKFAAKIKTMIGSFIWKNFEQRVSYMQLILPKNKGGLALHDVEMKCKSLLVNRFKNTPINRYILETFMNSSDVSNSARRIPNEFNYLKIVEHELRTLPSPVLDHLTSKLLYCFYLEKVNSPAIEKKYRQQNWKLIWKNIMCKKLKSDELSSLYLFVNEKIPNMEQFHRQGRVPQPFCSFCVGVVEDLCHKFSECQYSRGLWQFMIQMLNDCNIRTDRLNFNRLKFPSLAGYSRIEKQKIMETFGKYVHYIVTIPSQDRHVNDLVLALQ